MRLCREAGKQPALGTDPLKRSSRIARPAHAAWRQSRQTHAANPFLSAESPAIKNFLHFLSENSITRK